MTKLPTPFYDRDGITIYCSDCREILPLLPKFDLLLTDPPYGVEFGGKQTKHTSRDDSGYISGDSKTIGVEVVTSALKICERGIVFSGIRLMFDYPKPTDIGCIYCPSGAGVGSWGFVNFHPMLFYGKRGG